MESKQNRALKEFDSLYKMIDDVYHEIAISMHLTDSAFLILSANFTPSQNKR